MAYPAVTIANYFVRKGLEDNDLEMTPMKVIKLTYIAHGWYLALTGNPLINEEVEAWRYGPVINSVYQAFKEYGKSRIKAPYSAVMLLNEGDDLKFLERIWEVYKGFTGLQLSSITHQPNTPWAKTWQAEFEKTIPNDLIKNHYEELAKKYEQ